MATEFIYVKNDAVGAVDTVYSKPKNYYTGVLLRRASDKEKEFKTKKEAREYVLEQEKLYQKSIKSRNMATAKRKTTAKKTTRKPVRQTGKTSVREDKMHKAKKPGKRISATGKVYYERRANRSDIGKLLAPADVFPTKAKATVFAAAKNKNSRIYKYVVSLYPISKGGDGKSHIVRKVKKTGLGVTTGTCVRQNPDRSSTIYPSSGGDNPCPHGGRIQAKSIKMQPVGPVPLNGAKTKRKTTKTAKQKAAQSAFAINSRKAAKLVSSGNAKDIKAAWKMLKKK